MNRRDFFSGAALSEVSDGDNEKVKAPVISEFANKELPKVARTNSGLDPYTGPWGYKQIAHLLRRTCFGMVRSDYDAVKNMTMQSIVNQLLAATADPAPPVNTNVQDLAVPIGTTWVNAAFDPNYNFSRTASFKYWYTGVLIGQGVNLKEKMTLFWHNHFATETDVVNDARYVYKHHALLRQNALGNFKDLVKQITVDPAMLKYLNGNQSTKGSPNENYGRELFELFTVGKGPEIAPGNYTNYTEDDIKAAARVLTGWRDSQQNINSYFDANRHDTTSKTFSAVWGNKIITTNGDKEYSDLIDMIFTADETAKYICRKLYRYFVYYIIDQQVENDVIKPMADLLKANNFEIKPVLNALFTSSHFYDDLNIGCQIKNPIDLAVGLCRQYSVAFPPSSDYTNAYNMWTFVYNYATSMQMSLGDPPNVAGWAAYYQIPQFYELWINADTLTKRNAYSDIMATYGYKKNTTTIVIDVIAIAQKVSDPSDPNVIVAEFAAYLFPIAITATQAAALKEVLIPGLPDYEWTVEWNDYVNDPNNSTKRNAVKNKLQALLKFMMEMAEYQLN